MKYPINIPTMLIALILCVVPRTAGAADSARYSVTVEQEDAPTLHVSGKFTLESSTIGMYITASPQLEDGQAALISNLAVRTSDGKSIEYSYEGVGDWKLLDTEAGQKIEIEYDITLEHDQYSWGPGIDEVAYRQDDGLFFTGFSLFIVPGLSSPGSVAVDFALPDGWRASTPWQRTAISDEKFIAATWADLLRNCMFFGEHLEETVSLGNFEIVLAVGGELKSEKQRFVDAMDALLPAYVTTFGGMPLASRYLVVINAGDRSDGGAFPGSYSMLINGEVNEASSVVWCHGIAHELLHFWNGHTIAPQSPSEEEWFKEGFTDYLTITHLSRTGLDSWDRTTRKLENLARRYTIARRLMGIDDSMRAAGADKHNKRFLVYGGGGLVGFALDVRIREATDNRAGLDDLMKAIYREFGGEKRYTFEDIVRLANDVSGAPQDEFLKRFVAGTDFLESGPSFDAIGLQLTSSMDEFYISLRDNATASERAIAASIFGPGLR